MVARTQITLPPEDHRRAKKRAAALGISLAEYLRRLVARDLGAPRRRVSAEMIFDLGDSGASDVARSEKAYVGAAFSDEPLERRTR